MSKGESEPVRESCMPVSSDFDSSVQGVAHEVKDHSNIQNEVPLV